jgi:MFS family permease
MTRILVRTRWAVWFAAVAVYVLAVFHRTSLAVAGLVAVDRFGISAAELATFTMVQLLVYAGMQIPVGVLLDRYGARRLLVVGLTMMTAGQLWFACVDSYAPALAARVLVGAGDAMVFVSVLRLIASWFPPARTPLLNQLTGVCGQLGPGPRRRSAGPAVVGGGADRSTRLVGRAGNAPGTVDTLHDAVQRHRVHAAVGLPLPDRG